MLKQVNSIDSYEVVRTDPPAFTGGTANTRGDSGGTLATYTLFRVTGDVVVRLLAVCTVNLAGTGTLEVGIAGNTAALIAQSTGTDIDAGDIWIDATVAEVNPLALTSIPAATVIVNGADIIETTATADITAGQIYYICLWAPLSPGSKVEADYETYAK